MIPGEKPDCMRKLSKWYSFYDIKTEKIEGMKHYIADYSNKTKLGKKL